MKTCFTVLTNGYDTLKPPRIISWDWQYVCFTDGFIDCPPWECVITDKPNREVKIRADDLYHTLSLYVDASIQIIGDLNELIKDVPTWYTSCRHPHRSTIEEEGNAVIKLKGCDPKTVNEQLNRYAFAGFPDDKGLAECGILLRDLSDPMVRRINKLWYNEFIDSCGRDQLSFMYCFYKMGREPYLMSRAMFNKYFVLGRHT